MKTFTLYSIRLFRGPSGNINKIPNNMSDGLIINMEDAAKTWYIDGVFEREQLNFFKQVAEEGKHLFAQVVITSKDNPPATMVLKIDTITELSEGISVLFEAHMVSRIDDSLHDMLKSLVDEGYESVQLLEKFQSHMKNDATEGKQSLNKLYSQLVEAGRYHLI